MSDVTKPQAVEQPSSQLDGAYQVGEFYQITTSLFSCIGEVVSLSPTEIVVKPFRFDKDKLLRWHDGTAQAFTEEMILGRAQIVKAKEWDPT